MIEFINVSREYNISGNTIKALNNISFSINKGETVVVVGASGSGKSTLLNLAGGMDIATEGTIKVNEQTISNYSENKLTMFRRTEIGFIFQFYNLIPNLTVYENVAIAQKLGKKSFEAKDLLKAVNLWDRKDHFPRELSGGEMQRVSIARALCKNPKVLLCDEPTGALDSKTGELIIKLLRQMSIDYKKTVVIVTHNLSLADGADRIISLRDGCIELNV